MSAQLGTTAKKSTTGRRRTLSDDEIRTRVAAMPADELESATVHLAHQLAAGNYELLVLVGEVDARRLWQAGGFLSCSLWLAQCCDIEVSTARTQIRVARALREFPLIDSAMCNGRLSYAKVRTLVPHLTEKSEADLVDLAINTPAGRLGAAIAAWSQGFEPSDDIARRHFRERALWWRTDSDGMVTVVARLPPADAAAVCSVIDQVVVSVRSGGRNSPGASCSGAPADAPESHVSSRPSLAQQRVDALMVIATGSEIVDPDVPDSRSRSATTPGESDPDEPDDDPVEVGLDSSVPGNRMKVESEVVIHLRGDCNTLADGTPVPDHAVASLLPRAFVSLLFHEMEGNPIDASPRRRTPTRRQQRVLDERYPVCAHERCGATKFLQNEHKQPCWAGGETVLENLQKMCGPHNREKDLEDRQRWRY